MDGWTIADPHMAKALRKGRRTQLRVPASAPLAACGAGARIGVREACVPGRLRHVPGAGRDEEVSTALARADFVAFPDGWRRARDGRMWRGKPPRDAEELWVTPVHMPSWACRMVLMVEWTRRARLQAMTGADFKAEGWRWPLLRTRAFVRHWNITHPTPGCRWQDDPEVAVFGCRVETP